MRSLLLFLLLVGASLPSFAGEKADADEAGTVALTFINSYVKASFTRGWNSLKWVSSNPVVTDHFKHSLTKLYADALKKDPEVGYDADAVISGNDCPERFWLKSSKVTGTNAMVVLTGPKEYPRIINVRMVKSGDRWMVDGSGDLAR